jgi:hypothetical protein
LHGILARDIARESSRTVSFGELTGFQRANPAQELADNAGRELSAFRVVRDDLRQFRDVAALSPVQRQRLSFSS